MIARVVIDKVYLAKLQAGEEVTFNVAIPVDRIRVSLDNHSPRRKKKADNRGLLAHVFDKVDNLLDGIFGKSS